MLKRSIAVGVAVLVGTVVLLKCRRCSDEPAPVREASREASRDSSEGFASVKVGQRYVYAIEGATWIETVVAVTSTGLSLEATRGGTEKRVVRSAPFAALRAHKLLAPSSFLVDADVPMWTEPALSARAAERFSPATWTSFDVRGKRFQAARVTEHERVCQALDGKLAAISEDVTYVISKDYPFVLRKERGGEVAYELREVVDADASRP